MRHRTLIVVAGGADTVLLPAAHAKLAPFIICAAALDSRTLFPQSFIQWTTMKLLHCSAMQCLNMLNHNRTAQSEYDVCTSCGSLAQCHHDQEEIEEITAPQNFGYSCPDLPSVDGHTYDLAGIFNPQLRSSSSTFPVNSASGSYDVISPQLSRIPLPARFHESSSSAYTSTDSSAQSTPDTCDIVSNLPIPPDSEVFNTYGERLTNAQLLSRYGFALDGNENDIITFEVDDLPGMHYDCPASTWEVGEVSGGRCGIVNATREVLHLWPCYLRWESSSLVYNTHALVPTAVHRTNAEGQGMNLPRRSYRNTSDSRSVPLSMCVNSDAKISHELWVYCALFSLAQQQFTLLNGKPSVSNGPTEEGKKHSTIALLVQLADRQLKLEAQLQRAEFEVEENDDGNDDENDYMLREDTDTQASDKVRFCSCVLLSVENLCLARLFSRARRDKTFCFL
jgi:hypothetical protein